MTSRSEWVIRTSLSILVLWAWLAFGNSVTRMIVGRTPTNAELGIVAVAIFLVSYIIGSLVIRGVRSDGVEVD